MLRTVYLGLPLPATGPGTGKGRGRRHSGVQSSMGQGAVTHLNPNPVYLTGKSQPDQGTDQRLGSMKMVVCVIFFFTFLKVCNDVSMLTL